MLARRAYGIGTGSLITISGENAGESRLKAFLLNAWYARGCRRSDTFRVYKKRKEDFAGSKLLEKAAKGFSFQTFFS